MLGVVKVSDIKFIDNSVQVMRSIEDARGAFLLEASAEMVAQTARNSRVKTGQTKGSFEASVDEGAGIAYIGSNYENAIWEEFGTGIYAINGDGRKDVPWVYYDEAGERHVTCGKSPSRAFWNAYNQLKNAIIQECQRRFGDLK